MSCSTPPRDNNKRAFEICSNARNVPCDLAMVPSNCSNVNEIQWYQWHVIPPTIRNNIPVIRNWLLDVTLHIRASYHGHTMFNTTVTYNCYFNSMQRIPFVDLYFNTPRNRLNADVDDGSFIPYAHFNENDQIQEFFEAPRGVPRQVEVYIDIDMGDNTNYFSAPNNHAPPQVEYDNGFGAYLEYQHDIFNWEPSWTVPGFIYQPWAIFDIPFVVSDRWFQFFRGYFTPYPQCFPQLQIENPHWDPRAEADHALQPSPMIYPPICQQPQTTFRPPFFMMLDGFNPGYFTPEAYPANLSPIHIEIAFIPLNGSLGFNLAVNGAHVNIAPEYDTPGGHGHRFGVPPNENNGMHIVPSNTGTVTFRFIARTRESSHCQFANSSPIALGMANATE